MIEEVKEIVSKIRAAKPELPEEKWLQKITFNWNEEGLSTWDGGYDVNEAIRTKVVEALQEDFQKVDLEWRAILIFLVQQEMEDCRESEISTHSLKTCYNSLAALKCLEDIPLLLAANDETSFDANMTLYKDRLFYNGYSVVMNYLKSNPGIEEEVIEKIIYYAEYFGYDND